MRRVMLSLVALLTLVGVLTVGSSVSTVSAAPAVKATSLPSYVYVNHSACTQSYTFHHRVCYDKGDKWFYIYTQSPYTQPTISFPSNSGASGIGTFSTNAPGAYHCNNYSASIDEIKWNGGTNIYINAASVNGGCDYVANPHMGIYQLACYDGWQQICVWGGNFDYLVWFSATAGYDFIFTES